MTAAIYLDDLLHDDDLAALKKQVAAAIAGDSQLKAMADATPTLGGVVGEKLVSSLHLDPVAVLADGWCTAKAIHGWRDPEKTPPGKPQVLKLGKHSIARDIRPTITVKLGAEHSFPLNLAVTLSGIFEGVELTIAGGKIRSVGCGTCQLAIGFKVGGRPVTEPKTLTSFKLPGEYVFAQPLAIP